MSKKKHGFLCYNSEMCWCEIYIYIYTSALQNVPSAAHTIVCMEEDVKPCIHAHLASHTRASADWTMLGRHHPHAHICSSLSCYMHTCLRSLRVSTGAGKGLRVSLWGVLLSQSCMDIHLEPFKCSKPECQGCVDSAGGTPQALRSLTPVVILRSLAALQEFMCLVVFHIALHWNLCWTSSLSSQGKTNTHSSTYTGAEYALILIFFSFPPAFPIISTTRNLFPLLKNSRRGLLYQNLLATSLSKW